MEPQSQLRHRMPGSSPPLTDHNPPEAESSDEDDGDIPASKPPSVSPSKRLAVSSLRVPLRPHANQAKRSFPDAALGGIVLYPGSKKPRNGYNMIPASRENPPYLAPGSPCAPIATVETPSHVRSPSVSSGDVVEGLLNSLNDAFRHCETRRAQGCMEHQLRQACPPTFDQSDEVQPEGREEHAIRVGEQGCSLPLAISTSLISDALPPNPDNLDGVNENMKRDLDVPPHEESQPEIAIQTRVDTVSPPGIDAWEVPESPGELNARQDNPDATRQTLQPTKKRGRPPKFHKAVSIAESIPNSEPDAGKRKPGRPRKHYPRVGQNNQDSGAPTSIYVPGLTQDQLESHDPAECNNDDDLTDSEMLSEPLHESDTDSGDEKDEDCEDSFQHDVDVFNAHQARHNKEENIFGPPDDDILAIYLDYQPLRQLCKLLGNIAWAGAKGNWQWRYFKYDGAKTGPARALLPVLAKLEKLYQATPKAPNLEAQNHFLSEHANMLGYYFHKIEKLVEHIRTQRLFEHNEETHNIDSRKRKRMARDLVVYIIPMLAHVLASAWGLGGVTWSKTSFTSAAVEVLKRTLGWIMLLHPCLLKELEKCPLEEKPENHRLEKAWHGRNVKREEIAPLLIDLFQVIAAAPDRLAETEARAKKELQRRQRRLRRERQLKIEQEAAAEARRAAVAERKKRSLLSIHGIHYRLGTSTPTSRLSPSALESSEWSTEERRLLFFRIQASYPVCPDLNTLRWELNKTVAQTVAMTKHILGKMLAEVFKGYSVEERAAETRRIMRSYEVAGL
ncbi:hypothetical protein F4803DRAFT_530157 [Xylaria telfairii]|nr:hypothetical protein F4803DRAFT_530157 [Xylaria telfairii]